MRLLLLTLLLIPSIANAEAITTVSITCEPPTSRENGTQLLPDEIDKYQFFKDGVYLAESNECAYSYDEPGVITKGYQVKTVDKDGLVSALSKINKSPPLHVEVTVTIKVIQ